MIETLLGGLMGGLFRLAPEILKWLDRKNERAFELAMQDKALEFEKLRGANKMAEIGASAQAAWDEGALQALAASVKAQGRMSGIRWADALSVSVRPIITYWFMLLYCSVKTAGLVAALAGGAELFPALPLIWTADDMAVWAGLMNFWFLGRVFDRTGR